MYASAFEKYRWRFQGIFFTRQIGATSASTEKLFLIPAQNAHSEAKAAYVDSRRSHRGAPARASHVLHCLRSVAWSRLAVTESLLLSQLAGIPRVLLGL